MVSFSIDKQRGQVNVEWMSRPIDTNKKINKNQSLVLALTSMEQSPTFASRLKRKLLSGLILRGAYTTVDLKELIKDFLEVLTGKHSIEEFTLADNGNQKIIRFPTDINFYDYHLLVQHLNTELGDKKSFGVYKSDKLNYYVFQDTETLNNLVGFTSDRKFFSIYMLDDLETKQHLRINQKLKVETDWVERVNGTNAQQNVSAMVR
jgi:hypothetical protein